MIFWNRVVFGMDTYRIFMWFITYSMLGWLVESAYMSVCNRKITNRGFARGPFCPIYGVGALTVYFMLRPYADNKILLFVLGSLCATVLEFLTALLMKRIFGAIWWDYNDKPFNYKGILCLESSVAWGFYTLFLFMFLHNIVVAIVAVIPPEIGHTVGSMIFVIFLVDFITSLYREKKEDLPESVTERVEKVKESITNKIFQ